MIYDTTEAAQYLNVSVSAVKYHVHTSKLLKPQLVGHSLVFTKEKLDHFLATKPKRRGQQPRPKE